MRSLTDEETDVMMRHLHNGSTLPDAPMAWSEGASEEFPERNAHNTPYYKCKKVFDADSYAWIEETTQKLDASMPVLISDREVIYPKTRQCNKCRRAFVGVKGDIKMPVCVVECGCTKAPITSFLCTRCRLVQWLLQNKQDLTMENHPGFVLCTQCDMPVTLGMWRKLDAQWNKK